MWQQFLRPALFERIEALRTLRLHSRAPPAPSAFTSIDDGVRLVTTFTAGFLRALIPAVCPDVGGAMTSYMGILGCDLNYVQARQLRGDTHIPALASWWRQPSRELRVYV